jgi:signal transduction histidine kinase
VIFVTALNDTTDRVKAIEAGGDDFLTKPHNRLVLGARVRSLLKLKAATDALEDSYRKLRELEKLKDDLMKMIVHDLKTPLTSVVATLEMVGDGSFGPVTERQRDALLDGERKAEDLLELIEDLLEVARIEDAAVQIDPAPLSPSGLLRELERDWALRFEQAGVEVQLDVANDAPTFEADPALLKRLFANLLQNAITHSSTAVHVRLSARGHPEGVLFTVADDGPGIPPEYHEVIFRKFETVKARGAPRVRSSGLGLAFCKLAAEAHGGKIWVRSAEGEGSAFHVLLPLTPAPPAAL